MSFLHPIFALAAIAIAVPIILHLVRRREVRRLTFPAIRYLRRAEQRYARRLRLRHLLLLAVRSAIVLAAAVAAAGPLIGRGDAGDHRPTALAIIVDESQSSSRLFGDRSLLDLYVERADRTLGLATRDDRIALFSAVRPSEGVVTNDVDGAREHLRTLSPTVGVARLSSAIQQAQAWLGSFGERARELHVFTDLQRVSLQRLNLDSAGDPTLGDGTAVIVYAPEPGEQRNGALGNPVPEVEPLTAALQTRVSIPLVLFGGEPTDQTVVIRLVAGNNVVGMAEGRFGDHALLRLPPQESGWLQGYFEIERSGLAADDRRYFTWLVRPAPAVAVIGRPPEFVFHAVGALERGGRLRRVESAAADVWIADRGERVGEALAAGRSVIVHPPASPLELPRLNRRLSRARLPWQYEPQDPSIGLTRLAENRALAGLAGAEVRSYYRLVSTGLAPGDTAMIRLDDGEPWLIRGTTSEGVAYLLLASPLTREASDVPVSAGMVPFVDALIGDWARHGPVDPLTIDGVALARLPGRSRQVQYPDGSRRNVEGGSWFRADQAGHYRVLNGDSVLRAFSLNAPLSEADLARGTRAALEQTLPAADWSWSAATSADAWTKATFKQRRGRLAWRPLVVFLLLLSIVEASLAAAGRRQTSQ
ncbi:MAG: BatA domain-containing protein [Gemmatimonadales bacterium]|jgi:hypothetical protein